jgi:hypothetical protein
LYKASGGQKSGEERNGIFLRPILVLRRDAARMALGDASWYAAPIDHHSSSTGGDILHRAGRSRWWTILAFVPLINLIGLWVFAFTRWPDRASAIAR